MVALIPARAGSTRCPGKNTRLLNGHPLFVYSVLAALQSGVFSDVVLATDGDPSMAFDVPIDFCQGVTVYHRNPVADSQPDIEWVREYFSMFKKWGKRPDSFAILRPTSPFRTADTIRRAYKAFQAMADCGDSIRAVEPVKQTPYKMWTWEGAGMPIRPLLSGANAAGVPYHSCPTQTCPVVYVQNSSLEMSWTANVECHGTIHGRKVGPFFTTGHEGFSIDTEADWQEAVRLARADPALLPSIPVGTQAASAPI